MSETVAEREPAEIERNAMLLNALVYRAKHVREGLLIALGEEDDDEGRRVILDYVSWTDSLLNDVLNDLRGDRLAAGDRLVDDAESAGSVGVLLRNLHEMLTELESMLAEQAETVG